MGFWTLSTKLVPINPQKQTKNILPINNEYKYFFMSVFIKPAAMFTAKAGVKGMASTTAICVKFILDNFFIILSMLGCFSHIFFTLFFDIFFTKKYESKHPITVHIQEIIKPIMCPKAKKLTVIKTNNGKIGIIDSIIIKKHAKIGANAPIEFKVVLIQLFTIFANSVIYIIITKYIFNYN